MNICRRSLPYLLSLLTGISLSLAMPGSGGFWPLLPLALIPLFFALQGTGAKQAGACALLAGSVHYMWQLYWIVIVLKQYGGLPLYLALPALAMLALYMSIYLLTFVLVGRTFLTGRAGLWLLPALWVGIDWLRAYLFTGFPWMDLGYGLALTPSLLQFADLFGHHGLTFVIIMLNVSFYQLISFFLRGGRIKRRPISLLTPWLIILALTAYSQLRQKQISLEMAEAKTITVAIVQGNIEQNLKWSVNQTGQTVEKYLGLTEGLFRQNRPEMVVWPETALPFYPEKSIYTQSLQDSVSRYDYALLTGAPWFRIVDQKARDIDYYNSAQLLSRKGFSGSYYKSHLVPFGEYVPFRKYLPFLEPLVVSVGDFTPGRVEKTLDWQNARSGVLICFESVFADISRKWVDSGANVLVNLTNDAWYGRSSAPYHSLAMTAMRAVETRRSIVRSANTGFSAFISPLGTLVQVSPLFSSWVGVEEIPLLEKRTFFVCWGYLFAPLCLLIVGGYLLLYRRKSCQLKRL
ncbi:apolipoprotein N-acyltransferase [Desulfotalea psychrophila]|uniref:Apolipoprotein N-acyltransferase n=1 Tax=Desulfotalea psychrophila (strain LSv54 / DSM 12343) TaxID=177439 RepID=Q6AM86_DESPS|nr:apolipoprotein N-acyltransferase [Desulfotalea psychrophila]CAG36539.1 related to apolipoprotein N-acyltransferase [Desulfotalea psychrophila LSv54]